MHRLTEPQRSVLHEATRLVYDMLLTSPVAADILDGQDYRRIRWIYNLAHRVTTETRNKIYDYTVTGLAGKREVVTFHMEFTVEDTSSHIEDQIPFRLYVESDHGVTGTVFAAFRSPSIAYDTAQ
jgi:hypothetical protein